VKAESDICCTSSNAVDVVESIAAEWGVDTVIMIPDEYLALNVAKQTSVRIITWKGHCEVHERFTAEDIRSMRAANPGLVVLAHPECPPEVVAEADFAGSTSGMISYVGQKRPNRVVLVTECSMSDNVAVEYPDVSFVRPCNLCPHMKRSHTAENPQCARDADDGSHGRSVDRRARPRRRGSHAACQAEHAPSATRGRLMNASGAQGEAKLALPHTNPPHAILIEPLVRQALTEDLGRAGDITTDAIIPCRCHGACRSLPRASRASWRA
jgi:hypothetical protein